MKRLTSFANEVVAAVGGTYEFTRFASANLRERDDSLNQAIGGFLAGSILGLRGEWFSRGFGTKFNADMLL